MAEDLLHLYQLFANLKRKCRLVEREVEYLDMSSLGTSSSSPELPKSRLGNQYAIVSTIKF